jgi:hypothetical protein
MRTLKQIPSQPGKLQIILHNVVEAFTPGALYTEMKFAISKRQVNQQGIQVRRDQHHIARHLPAFEQSVGCGQPAKSGSGRR